MNKKIVMGIVTGGLIAFFLYPVIGWWIIIVCAAVGILIGLI